MSEERKIVFPPGFIAEVVAAASGHHVGAHNKGYDFIDADAMRAEVKSAAVVPSKKRTHLEIKTSARFPDGCDRVYFATTSGVAVPGRVESHVEGDHLRVVITAMIPTGDAGVRVYRLDDLTKLDPVRVQPKGAAADEVRGRTWRVAIADCELLPLS